jgi:uncharacterized protein (TIGR02118 family)
MGRSRGGLTTKIHALVDARGLPIALKLTPGQAHDGRSAADMLDTLGGGDVLLALLSSNSLQPKSGCALQVGELERPLGRSERRSGRSPTMIKMSVYYPANGGSKFDHDYYRTRHMPLIQERLGDACLRYEIDKGLAGREPGSAPEFVAACHIYSPTLGTFQEAFGPHRSEIVADVANYTDIAPIVQISEIVGG